MQAKIIVICCYIIMYILITVVMHVYIESLMGGWLSCSAHELPELVPT